ncbi:MAG TPA: hypothetical protein DCL21_05130 [Alphaproteobacteria bacterium]|nr:hypothetical protein [Alphaproteobacteria bacterium]
MNINLDDNVNYMVSRLIDDINMDLNLMHRKSKDLTEAMREKVSNYQSVYLSTDFSKHEEQTRIKVLNSIDNEKLELKKLEAEMKSIALKIENMPVYDSDKNSAEKVDKFKDVLSSLIKEGIARNESDFVRIKVATHRHCTLIAQAVGESGLELPVIKGSFKAFISVKDFKCTVYESQLS